MSTRDVLVEVEAERRRQDETWGEQNHPDTPILGSTPGSFYSMHYPAWAATWKHLNERRVGVGAIAWDGILLEEVFEALSETDSGRLRAELVQVAAVAVNWIEAIDRRGQS